MIHFFKHHELALKYALRTTSFEEVDSVMLFKCYYSYQKSPKCLSELRELSEAYDITVPNPSKATEICWMDHKY